MKARVFAAAAVSAVVAAGAVVGLAALCPPRASAAPSPSASASSAARDHAPAVTLAEYKWPTTASKAPAEDDWDGAAALLLGGNDGLGVLAPSCHAAVIREWVRVTCVPPGGTEEDDMDRKMFGGAWLMAGSPDELKGHLAPAAAVAEFKGPPQSPLEEAIRQMGGNAVFTFAARPGVARLIDVSVMFFDTSGWGGDPTVVTPGAVTLDVSWAKGEAGPTILLR